MPLGDGMQQLIMQACRENRLPGHHGSGKALEDVVDCFAVCHSDTGLQIVYRKCCLYQVKV